VIATVGAALSLTGPGGGSGGSQPGASQPGGINPLLLAAAAAGAYFLLG
jgi:hypothetical protein